MECFPAEHFDFGTDVSGGDLLTIYKSEATNRGEAQIDLIYFDAGGGHRASATALISAARQQHRGWQINLVNLRELLEPADMIRRLTGVRIEDFYNSQLKYGLTIGTGPLLRITQMLIRQLEPAIINLLARHWQYSRADLVVSMIPNFNHAILQGLRQADAMRARSETPMVTILTDLADCPPHFWIERQEQYLICGTAKAVEQALAMGYPPTRVLRTSGMIVRPEFYRRPEISREQERRRLGLRPDVPTGLVMFGGFGSRRMLTIARRVAEAGVKTQLIFLCGHNQRLREQLSAMKLPFPCHVEGFTRDIPHLMQLSDYFVGKPGPGSVSEALVMDLPVIVECNARTMVQERYNTEWIERHQFGMVLRSFNEIVAGIAQMLDPQRLAHFRSRVRALNNRAVFEIPDLLEALIAAAPGESAPAAFQALA